MSASDRRMILLVWVVILAVYVPTLLAGRFLVEDPGINDVSANWMTNYSWVGQAYREGRFPLWNPHIFCGMPLLGYTHCMGLYPPSILFFSLLPHLWAGSLSIVFHSLLCAILFYILMRQYSVGPALAAAASLVGVLSGSFFGTSNIFEHLGTIAGLLFLWICLRRAFQKPRLLPLLGGALGLAWSALSGEPEVLTYSLIGLYLVLILEAEAGWNDRLKRSLLIFVVTVWTLVLITALLFPTLETVHFSVRGPSFPFPLEVPRMGEYRWLSLYTWVIPFRYYRQILPSIAANYGLSPLYQGFLMPGLLLWGLSQAWKNRELRALAAGWVLLLLWALLREGTTTGVFFDRLPVLGPLQFGGKAFIMIHLLGVVLAFQALAQAGQTNGEKKTAWILGIILIASGAMAAISLPWSMGGMERLVLGVVACLLGAALMIQRRGKTLVPLSVAVSGAIILWVIEIVILAGRYHPRTDPARYRLAPAVENFARKVPKETRYAVFEPMQSDAPQSLNPLFGLFELASGAGNLAGSPRIPPARIFLYLNQILPNLITETPSGQKIFTNLQGKSPWTLDLSRLHLFHLAGVRLILRQEMPLPLASPYSLLSPLAAQWQIVGLSDPKTQGIAGAGPLSPPFRAEVPLSALPGDQLHLEYQAQAGSDGGWLTLTAALATPSSYRLLWSRYAPPSAGGQPRLSLEPLATAEGRLRLTWLSAGAEPSRLRLTRLELVNPRRPFQRVAEWGAVSAFVNQEALPRAGIVHQATLITDWEHLLPYLNDSSRFLPSQEVLLETSDREVEAIQRLAGPAGAPGPGEEVQIISYGAERVEMVAQLSRPGWVVFSDTYFPGWRAYVNAKGGWREVKVRPANLAFRALGMWDGVHQIRWLYQPVSFRIGLWVSLASLLSLLGLMVRQVKRFPPGKRLAPASKENRQ